MNVFQNAVSINLKKKYQDKKDYIDVLGIMERSITINLIEY